MSDEHYPEDEAVVEYTPPKGQVAPRDPLPTRTINVPQPQFPVAAISAAGASVIAEKIQMLQMQATLAMQNPRHEDTVLARVMDICRRKEFAEKALYSFPVSGARAPVSGPSIVMARELANAWGNLIYGVQIIEDTPEKRTIRAWALDLERNVRPEDDTTFFKVVERKVSGKTVFREANEREVLMLHNANASKAIRNQILKMIPDHIKRMAVALVRKTMVEEITANPEVFRDKLIASFGTQGIQPKDIEDMMGRPIKAMSGTADAVYLRGVYTRLVDGSATWHDILAERAEELGLEGPPPRNAKDLREQVTKMAGAAKDPAKKKGAGDATA